MVPAGHPKAQGCTPGLAPAPQPVSPVRSPTPPAPSVVWPRLSSLGCPLCPSAGWLPCTGHAVPWPRPPGGLSSQALGGPACPGGHRGSQPCLAAKPQRAALTAGHVWSERRLRRVPCHSLPLGPWDPAPPRGQLDLCWKTDAPAGRSRFPSLFHRPSRYPGHRVTLHFCRGTTAPPGRDLLPPCDASSVPHTTPGAWWGDSDYQDGDQEAFLQGQGPRS